jgi:hypothetical protein
MSADQPPADPDIARLFAPVAVEETFAGVLSEAAGLLGQIDDPVDAELWGSDLIGALAASAAGQDSLMQALAESLVPAAEAACTPESLALLRVLAALGAPALRAAAGQAAGRLHARGVADPPWAATLGAPRAGDCWHYADVGGRHESLTMTFSYADHAGHAGQAGHAGHAGQAGQADHAGHADRSHAVSVLIDHGRGGKIRDAWVAKGAGLRAETEQAARDDPLVVFETIEAADAGRRLARAIAAGECPEQPDQVDDVVAHRALLHARLELLLSSGSR